MLRYSLFKTSWGWMGVAGSEGGVRLVVLPQDSPDSVRRWIASRSGHDLHEDKSAFANLCLRLRRYLDGHRVSLEDKLDMAGATPFQLLVWQAARSIPWGQTRSYAWLAQRLGHPQACRAVGRALAANPVPLLVPCHRVVGQRGHLVGYGGGLALKKHLLDIETHTQRF